jgi:glutamate synthase domain-containing protein 2/glutamate synthase domain-containing protein 1/glutamate synthase domain-containing protein 3
MATNPIGTSPEGLYDPSFEHDACGVGFIVNLKGEKSHEILHWGFEILVNLEHRGACGCDPQTGDGCGILLQMPHEFLKEVAADAGVGLPAAGDYAAGLVFLPRERQEREHCQRRFAELAEEEGQRFLGWRDVPVDHSRLGFVAREVEPVIRQVFIGRGDATPPDLFDWKLYVIRRRLENEIRTSDLSERKFFYVPSLTSRVIVYKGLMLPSQARQFYPDLSDERFVSALALVHQRYSTNTFPTWDLAHPFRFLAHNGEINTLRGNVNWMHARERMLESPIYGPDLGKIFPVCTPGASDSAIFDNVLELLVLTGRSLPEAMSMLIPEPWAGHESMSDEKKAYYEYKACLMEPWDGPASMAFTDGTVIGAVLDRNGLRPSRYWVTANGHVVMASEAGVLEIPPDEVESKGRLRPGRMFLVDTRQGRIIADDELKTKLASARPYRRWLDENRVCLGDLPPAKEPNGRPSQDLAALQRTFGYTLEDLRIILGPMALEGQEPVGSMGNDAPLAVLSDRPQLLYNYFKQLFAQVTNPPLDAIREEIITSMITTIGSEGNLLAETPEQCRLLRLETPILTNEELARIKLLDQPGLRCRVLSTVFPAALGPHGMRLSLDALRSEASRALEEGATILVLSDRGCDSTHAPLPALLAASAVHHHLIRQGTRTRCGLVVESGEPREVHHFALLTGYGAGAVNPYLAFATLHDMQKEGLLPSDLPPSELETHFIKAAQKGVLKVMSKMGISTQQSYRGAQIFEAIGLQESFVDEFFSWTPSRIQGIGLDEIAREVLARHEHGFPGTPTSDLLSLDVGGQYQWRRKGEAHLFNPDVVASLQQAARINSPEEFRRFCKLIDDQERQLLTLRGLLSFRPAGPPVPIADVEPAREIVKRFATGAMSFGSISKEAHETLAIAMNRIGGKSNTGEGGEDAARYVPDSTGDSRASAIKQVASGRFGVTSEYLVNARELQIKMAQGAKPGEGGQLPGHKVDREIARIRHSTPGVGLISPPPHHDIYSIEDLSQLIHDLKNANRFARISVKLVAEVGVGTVAAGVAKGKSDVVLISGHDGGTGASPQTSIKHAGIPWELGLAETHQVLVRNNLRGRIIVQTDGQLRTAKDVAVAAMLGAEEWGIATASLVVMGCIMMRKCHLNTCPVGIATQDPLLRAKFAGTPESVVNYFFLLAEELRALMASLGFRTINEMVGRSDCLDTAKAIAHWKARGLDFSTLLEKPKAKENVAVHCVEPQDHGLEKSLDLTRLLDLCRPALERMEKVKVELPINNTCRTVGTILSSEITRRFGPRGLDEDTIELFFKGSSGQSLMAFGVRGVTCTVEGDVNDYCAKGLSGGKVIVFPPRESRFVPEDNVIAGNVVLYGATSGEVYLRGIAGERFCVRNSGATAVVEGVGDHGCEYMTGGRAVILGETGRNFAAGMSGGMAYVWDQHRRFKARVNTEMVEFENLDDPADQEFLWTVIHRHVEYTLSARGKAILARWPGVLRQFVKIMPTDYKRALAELNQGRTGIRGVLAGAAHG